MLRDDRILDRASRAQGAETHDAGLLDRLAVLAQAVGTARDLTDVYRALLDFTVAVVPTNGLFVSLYDPIADERRCVYAWSEGEQDVSRLPALPLTDSPNSRSVATNRIIVTDDLQEALAGQPKVDLGMEVDPTDPQSSIAVPMAVLGRVIGGFEVQSTKRAAYTDEHVVAMRMAANLAAIATENVRLLDRERELREAAEISERRYRALVEGLDAIVYEADAETGALVFVSQPLETILGYPVDDWTSDPGAHLRHIHPDDRDAVAEAFASGARAGGRLEVEYRAVAADGRSVWLRDISIVTAGPGEARGRRRGVMIDVSERRGLEARSLQAQKMESIGRLAGTIAHDFNNLLTAITGYSDLLAAELPPDTTARSDVEEIRRAAGRASALTGQLLAFGRRQLLQPVALDLNAIVTGVEPMLRRLMGENVELRTELDTAIGAVRADVNQLEQVLVNLAVNARDAMPGGGTVTIRTGMRAFDAGAPPEPDLREGRYATITVTDTGIGMDDATLANVFEPFFTTKERGRGTGLGLATAYAVVAQTGGHISAESEPGVGTTFSVYLPIVDEPLAPQAAPEERPAPVTGHETVLVAEDDEAVRAVVCGALRRSGYRVLEASDADVALAAAAEHSGPIDLLIADLLMPGATGPELSDRLRAVRPNVRVVFVSGYGQETLVEEGLRGEHVAFLAKPFAVGDLLRTIRAVLGER